MNLKTYFILISNIISLIFLNHYDENGSCHAFSSSTATYTKNKDYSRVVATIGRRGGNRYNLLARDNGSIFMDPLLVRSTRTSCLFVKENKKNKIAGPRASSRSSVKPNVVPSNENKSSPWDKAKDTFYFAYDNVEQRKDKKRQQIEIGAGYQDDENEELTRERLSIQEDEADFTSFDENKKNQGLINNLLSNFRRNSKNSGDGKILNPIVETVEQVSRNEKADSNIQNPDIKTTSPTSVNSFTNNKTAGKNKMKSNSSVRQIDMDPPSASVSDKAISASESLKEMQQKIQSNIETAQKNWNQMEDAFTELKVFLNIEKPKLEPKPPKTPKASKEIVGLTSTDVAKFSVEAAGGLTVGLVNSIGSSTAWAMKKGLQQQKKNAQLKKNKGSEIKFSIESLAPNLDWTKKVERIDTVGRTTEDLLAELDPELSLEVTEALKLAEEALNQASSNAPGNNVKTENNKEKRKTSKDQSKVVDEEEEIVVVNTAPLEINMGDTSGVQMEERVEEEIVVAMPSKEEIPDAFENFEKEKTKTVLAVPSKPVTAIKDGKIEVTLRDVDDALRRARKAAEEAKRDVEELEKMLMALD